MSKESKLKAFNLERSSFKTQLTNLEKYVDKIISENTSTEEVNLTLTKKLQLFSEKYLEFQTTQKQIETLTENEPEQFEIREDLENRFVDITVQVEQFISKVPDVKPSTQSMQRTDYSVKLPSIDLPEFDGNYLNWRSFEDSFVAFVDKNDALSEVQKLCYLRSKLKNEAWDIIKSLETTSENYALAFDLIKDRFNHHRRIVYSHINTLLNIKFVNSKTFINTVDQHVRSLQSLKIPIIDFNALLIPLLISKLDSGLVREWEVKIASLPKTVLPTYDDFRSFMLFAAETSTVTKDLSKSTSHSSQKGIPRTGAYSVTNSVTCALCNDSHYLFQCQRFLLQDVSTRIKTVNSLRLCLNCLKKGHFAKNCRSTKCKICRNTHNSLLHLPARNSTQGSSNKAEGTITNISHDQSEPSPIVSNCSTKMAHSYQTLLSTAQILIEDSFGNVHQARALLDSASQTNFITNEFVKKCNLSTHNANVLVSGIGDSSSNITHCAEIKVRSKQNNYSRKISCLVLDKITENIPYLTFSKFLFSIPTDIPLADEQYNESQPIDVLLGASIFWDLMRQGQRMCGRNRPILKNTVFGWIISGSIPIQQSRLSSYATTSIDDQIERLWQLDEFEASTRHLSSDDIYCNTNFLKTVCRNTSDRLVVDIPFKANHLQLGDSKTVATNRFYSLERRLQKDIKLQGMYIEFMREYIRLGHMSQINSKLVKPIQYFLPHHPVLRATSTTTKLRVVFDGSHHCSNGLSLNDVQLTGPSLQTDIFAVLLKFRQHTFVATGDIEKMYRQILINPDQRCFQQVLWREKQSDELVTYQLNTVTYGTASAPYLAMRCLHYLADESAHQFPKEAQIIKTDIYVDDLLTGAETVDELRTLCTNIYNIFKGAGFIIRKWNSNTLDVQGDVVRLDNIGTNIYADSGHRALGIKYDPSGDIFSYSPIETIRVSQNITKRHILKNSAKIFDPLGILSPVTIIPKIIIQQAWKEKLGWDDPVSDSIKSNWIKFVENVRSVDSISFPRHVFHPDACVFKLHGYADASEMAYGACVYVQSILSDGSHTCNLITARSKVAPIKNVTIPRLELCAALLLARLVHRVKEIFTHQFESVYFWSDSKITLSWIHSCPSRWKTFVANRVAEIQRLSASDRWFYVPTNDNPADLITRGTSLMDLKDSKMWWHGTPHVISTPYSNNPECIDDLPEQKVTSLLTNLVPHESIFDRYSSLTTLINVTAFCLRFAANCRTQTKTTGELTKDERARSLYTLVKLAQKQAFPSELTQLQAKGHIDRSSVTLSLNPFLDSDGLMRVGGRLKHSSLDYSQKHPILLPKNHKLTELIASDIHKTNLHVGSQQLLYIIRETYWPISGISLSKRVIRNCIRCFRTQPKECTHLMGNLPSSRVIPSPPFNHCGIDYAGPFYVKDRRAKGFKKFKSYICLFVCFATKAIHLELVSDLTTASFLSALRRFISRRGKPNTIYSDNATNFVRANKELQDIVNFVHSKQQFIVQELTKSNIKWNFIPPRSPHFGGIWEAQIRSIKRHLQKTIVNTVLTIEEFYTVLVQIEAVVNSRPLSPLSSDPNDLNPLTPAHFLIGRSLLAAPVDDMDNIQINRLSHHQMIQRLVQSYWKRWQQEYVHQLQHRPKWQLQKSSEIKIGQLVLLKEDNTPPGAWRMGRIIQVWPGSDGVVRVVTVKTQTGEVKRAITRLCVMPIVENNQ